MSSPASKKTVAPVPMKVKRQVIGISVKFELNARTGLRRVVFGLVKSTEGDIEKWTIAFQLFEREKKSEEFTKIVDLEVKVDTTLNKQAETTAQNGLTEKQAAHALGTAAEDTKAAEAGEIEKEEAEASVAATLKKK